MTRQQKHPLRELNPEERQYLEKVSRSQSESASRVVRAKLLLAVAEGSSYTDAAHSVGRHSGDAVGKLVVRFNEEGIAALNLRHGGGPSIVYGSEQRSKILEAIQKQPDRQTDGRDRNVEFDDLATESSRRGIRFSPGEYLHIAQSFERIGMELAKESKLV